MTPAQRLRLEDIARRRLFAPTPTAEDIRVLLEEQKRLLAENARLLHVNDALVKTAADCLSDRLLETPTTTTRIRALGGQP